MYDPSTYWLTFTNIALGLVTLICCGAVGIGVAQELAARRKKKLALSKLDREVTDLVASYGDRHAFTSPGSVSPWPMVARNWGRKRNGSRMPCPFLKETEVKYCRSSTIRKLIPMAQAGRAEERCSSEGYAGCPVFQQQPDAGEVAAFGSCPYLHESLMQYCGAASVTKFVPYSESLLSRCGNDTYRYCELYLAMAHPAPPAETVDGLQMPAELGYSANHMWVDVTEDGVVPCRHRFVPEPRAGRSGAHQLRMAKGRTFVPRR